MYLDPGFGGMLVQVFVAIAAAGGIILFSLRRKLRAFFSKKKDTDTSGAIADADATKSADIKATDGNNVLDILSDEKPEEKAADEGGEKSDSE